MPKLILRYCTIQNPKAVFLNHEITFSVSLPLTDDNLKLRDKFELLAAGKESVTVEIESAQLPLFDDTPPVGDPDIVTLSTKDKSVTITAEQLHAAARDGLSDYGVSGADGAFIDKELNRHAAKLDAELKRVKAKRTRKAKPNKRA